MIISRFIQLSCLIVVSTGLYACVSEPNISQQPTQNLDSTEPEVQEPTPQASPQPAEQSQPTQQNSIELVELQPPSSPTAEEPKEQSQQLLNQVIQTQYGPEGTEVDLTSTKVTGQVMTVAIRYRRTPESIPNPASSYPIQEVSYTDDATSRQFGVLQDQAGAWLASPKNEAEGEIEIDLGFTKPHVVAWFKFPAPPPEAQTISINIPEVAPFDGVRIER